MGEGQIFAWHELVMLVRLL